MQTHYLETKIMDIKTLHNKALAGKPLSLKEGVFLYTSSTAQELFALANHIRFKFNPYQKVSWQIDRNVNYTNICISGCLFCNFHCTVSQKEKGFTVTKEEYTKKIAELRKMGGDQILLQGGLHPNYDITFYEQLFSDIKSIDPDLKLNALGPPEISHIARISKISIEETLKRLIAVGLTSLPGAGAEILTDRVRKILSPSKPNSAKWVEVMKCAHQLGLGSTATMVYGHIETLEDKIQHLITIREIQDCKPHDSPGFRAFICWPMQTEGTKLAQMFSIAPLSAVEHLKMVAISRIMLNNILHIQASWLTIGPELGKVALHCGADDMGSIMIEENVVSSAGADYRRDKEEMQKMIIDAGFDPWLRNQDYTPR